MDKTGPNYTNYELRQELTRVFDSVWFDDKDKKKLIEDSYFLSFDSMIKYARETDVNEKEYLRGIKKFLLTIPGTYLKPYKNNGR